MSKMIKCAICGEEIADNAKSCPKCGAKNKKPFYKKWWIWAVVAVVVIAVAGGNGGNNETSDGENASEKTPIVAEEVKKEKYEIVGEVEIEKDMVGVYLIGTIKNNSGKECSYLQVTFNLYDAEGNQIGTALDNINNLEKDGTWKFKAMGIDTDGEVASFKLAEISGF